MLGDAEEARRRPGTDERPDLDPAAAEDDRQMRDVATEKQRCASRVHDVVGEHDDRHRVRIKGTPYGLEARR